ncbi:MAG TPA: NAD(P)H-binding protein [Bacteroidia bacterium]|jgi:putative NADH-flavin reductase|nr:NAD(P)H-binding protein [Bacteroidia bacterium]
MYSHKIALFGTPDEVSHRLLAEALKRGHTVTAIVPDKNQFQIKHPNLKVVKGDVKKKTDVNQYATGHDTVICAHEPAKNDPHEHVGIVHSVLEGVKDAGVNNVLFTGHPVGIPVENTEEFYNSYKPIIAVQRKALDILHNERQLHWGYTHSVEPEKTDLQPGRSPKYSYSSEILFAHPEEENRIPVKEYASAIIDEAEKGEMELHEHGDESEREY